MSQFLVLFCLNICFLESYSLTTASEADNSMENYILGSTKVNLEEQLKRIKRGANAIPDCIYFNFKYEVDRYDICLHLNYMPSLNLINEKESMIITYLNENQTIRQPIADLKINFAQGYVTALQNSSAVRGYIHDDSFLGSITTDTYKYNIEPVPQTNSKGRVLIGRFLNKSKRKQKPNIHGSGSQEYNSRVCTLNIVVDYSFYAYVGRHNTKQATAIVLNSLDRVNSLFRSTDFNEDGIPDNIGFEIENVIVLNVREINNMILSPFQIDPIDPHLYMVHLVTFDRGYRRSCLLVGFTSQPFTDRVIGLSFVPQETTPTSMDASTGGICSSGRLASNNILVITYRQTTGALLIQVLTDHSLAHELGHSFGSLHDPENDDNCKGYVMSSKVKEIDKEYLTGFSPCSKKSILNVINNRPKCLITTSEQFCGNGIIEANEECDCGFFYHCIHYDQCCQPRADPEQCKINRYEGYECHPMQGLCCKNDCLYENLSHIGLDCKKYLYGGCSENKTECGFEGTCQKGHCHSNECVRIGLEECACPKNITKYCQICCLHENKCQAAVIVTRLLMQRNATLGKVLRKTVLQNRVIDKIYTLCVKRKCIYITFMHFQASNYCLLFGTLGHCSQKFQCITKLAVPGKLPQTISKDCCLHGNKICSAVLFILFYVFVEL